MSDVLVLNADFNPLSIIPLSTISWQDAIRLIYLDKVSAIEYYENWEIRSQRQTIVVPTVVITKQYFANQYAVKFSKRNLLYRDDYKCQYCNKFFPQGKDLTLDHVIPKKDGGKRSWQNIVIACHPCNNKKSHHYHMRPIKPPHKPTYFELMKKRIKFPVGIKHESWKKYLPWDENLIVENCIENDYNLTVYNVTF